MGPESELAGLNLRLTLDIRLFSLVADTTNYTMVKEAYAVKGIPMTKQIGSWNETSGLNIEKPNIWERRDDLNGVTVRVTSLNFR